MTEARRHDSIALAILALIATLLFVDVAVGTHNFYMRDLTRYYYPTKQVVREVILDGHFPYWNRNFAGGQPIAANPEHEVFYPLTWLILLPDYDFGYRWHILIHLYIGLFGMYALLRSMKLRAFSAAFGALTFALGGIYMSYVNLLPILFCIAWLPLTCLYVRRFMFTPSVRSFAFASLFLGLQMLVGEPTSIAQTGLLLGMYALYRGWYAARDHDLPWTAAIPEMLTRVFFVGLISIAGFCVGAAQMLSAVDHVGDSARSRPFEFSLVSAWSMPWAKFAEMIYPNFLGHMALDRITFYWAGGLYPGMSSPFIFNVYSGLLVTALAVAALFVRPRGGRLVLLLAFFSFLLALGGNTPLLKWLYELGVAQAIRYPEKFVLIAGFAAILLAAKLLDRLLDGDEAVREAAMGFVAAVTVVAGAICLVSLTPYYGRAFAYVWGLSGGSTDRMIDLSQKGWVISFVRGAVLFALLWVFPRLNRKLWLAMLGVFVLADVLPIARQVNPVMPSRFFRDKPASLAQLPEPRDRYRLFHEVDWYAREEVARKYFSTGAAVYWVVRNGIYPMTPVGYGVQLVMERDYDKTALLPTIAFTEAVWDLKRSGRPDWWRPAMAMSNAWYRAAYRPYDTERKRVSGRMEKARPVEFVKGEEYPRYYFADELVQIHGKRDFVDKLASVKHSIRAAFVSQPAFTPARGIVRGVREDANSATIDVEAFGRAFLVMSVTPHKYWRVTIDGKEASPVVTNLGYQGVAVPEGRHRVEMRYRNTVVVYGAQVSLVSILLLLAALLVRPRRA
ncbi:MAG TPA: hypothetical protein VE974_01740 [Thermoanaerobaculia bacterium]|nr:hypothetical protein [Thermoanaerobaculia bacterium]